MKKRLPLILALMIFAGPAGAQVWFKGTVEEAVTKAKAIKPIQKAVEFASPAAKPAMHKNLDKIKSQAGEKK